MPYFFDLDQRTGGAFVFSICRFRHPTGQGPLLLLTYSDIFKHISRKTWRVMRRCEFDLINVFERHLGNLGVRCFFWLEECGNGGVTRNFCILGAYVTWLWFGSLKRYEEIGALLWNFFEFLQGLNPPDDWTVLNLSLFALSLVQLVRHTADMLQSIPVPRSWNFQLSWSTQTTPGEVVPAEAFEAVWVSM